MIIPARTEKESCGDDYKISRVEHEIGHNTAGNLIGAAVDALFI